MICKTCSQAADLVTLRRNHPIQNTPVYELDSAVSTHEAIRAVVHLLHGLCKGQTHCDCNHVIDWEGTTAKRG